MLEDSIRIELTSSQLKHAIITEELFNKNVPSSDEDIANSYLADLKSADNLMKITRMHAKSNRFKLVQLKEYLEKHDPDLECHFIDNQILYVNINNYWNGINDGFSFYIEKQIVNDYLTLVDDGWLHFEKEVHTPGIRYDDVINNKTYSDIHKFKEEFVMLADAEPEKAFENVEKYKRFLIESYSAYYDKIE